jgi:hypothetical protein
MRCTADSLLSLFLPHLRILVAEVAPIALALP